MSGPAADHPRAVLLVLACGGAAAMHVGKLPPALPALRESLGLNLVQAGWLLGLVQLAAALMAMALGWGADRIGHRRALVAGLLTLGLASLLGSSAREGWVLMAWRAVEGLGFLWATLAAPALIRRLSPPERHAPRLGWWGAYMPAGTAAALLLGPAVMQRNTGVEAAASANWPLWWQVLGLLTLGLAVAAHRALPALPPAPSTGAGRTSRGPSEVLGSSLIAVWRHPPTWRVAGAFGCYSSQWLAVIGFLPSLYAQAAVSAATAAPLTALAAAANIVGNVMAGRALQAGVAPARLIGLGCAAMALGAAVFFGGEGWLPMPLRFAAVLLFSGVGGLIPGTLFATAMRVAPSPEQASTVVGWMLQVSAMGQLLGPLAVAAWAQARGGWSTAWWCTGLAALACAALGRGLGRAPLRSA